MVSPRFENTFNMRKHVRGTFIYKGVGRDKRCGKRRAEIGLMGVTVARCGFREEADAARAYDRLAVELFGEAAGLNFSEEWPPQRRAQVCAEASEEREALLAKAAKAKKQKRKAGRKKGARPPKRPKPQKKKGRKRAGRTSSTKRTRD